MDTDVPAGPKCDCQLLRSAAPDSTAPCDACFWNALKSADQLRFLHIAFPWLPVDSRPVVALSLGTRLTRLRVDIHNTWHVRLQLANLLLKPLPDLLGGSIRARLYRRVGIDVGHRVAILGNLKLVGGHGLYERLSIGEGAIIGYDVCISLDSSVSIGPNASISAFVRIMSATHPIGPASSRRLAPVIPKPVVVEEGAWIGVGAIILPGVTVGRGAIVGAGAVVAADIEPNSYAEGNPAKSVRALPWSDR